MSLPDPETEATMKKLTIASVACAFLLLADSAAAQVPSPAVREELAGTGKVRVALVQPAGGAASGMGVSIGKELADRVGAPFEPVVYPSAAAALADARANKWDAAIVVRDPARAADVEYTRPYALPDNPGTRYAIGVPKGRAAAAMYVDAMLMDLLANGVATAK